MSPGCGELIALVAVLAASWPLPWPVIVGATFALPRLPRRQAEVDRGQHVCRRLELRLDPRACSIIPVAGCPALGCTASSIRAAGTPVIPTPTSGSCRRRSPRRSPKSTVCWSMKSWSSQSWRISSWSTAPKESGVAPGANWEEQVGGACQGHHPGVLHDEASAIAPARCSW